MTMQTRERLSMETDESGGRGRLAQLIQERVDAGESSRTIAARAQQHGHKLSHAQVNYLQRGMVTKAPDTDMIEALAAGLRVSVSVIRRAVFIDWYGYDPREVEPEDTRVTWPLEVRIFLDALGQRLSVMDDHRREQVITELTRKYILGM